MRYSLRPPVVVVFAVPPQLPRTSGSPPLAPPPAAPAPRRPLLYLEDNPDVAEMMQEYLCLLGYEPTWYATLESALDALRAQPQRFRLVVTDLHLGGPLTAQDTIPRLLAVLDPTIPVLVHTALPQVLGVLPAGCQVLVKPGFERLATLLDGLCAWTAAGGRRA